MNLLRIYIRVYMKNKYKIKALALIDIKCKSFFMFSTNNR